MSAKVEKIFKKITNWDPYVGKGYFDGNELEPIGALLDINNKIYVTNWGENPDNADEFLIDREKTYVIVSVDDSLVEAYIEPVRKKATLDLIEREINERKPWNCLLNNCLFID
ncbi:MAG: hypothetical protein GTN38_00580 [Candidatus Aenigmarchaeota archaeon]|nr:hypothetical protein [Candidatus Aenigmarchaeota archaeon]NIP40080.1 hypothetical protein [Candidatus Aenigmarchaeota archaeon]NIQ18157.1 hypothetical protein [Candidatus Aenigmarchaeota archaeon]NIS72914.1 hypothetical protein [Candidatus Aenigmarchaeota archaeon]